MTEEETLINKAVKGDNRAFEKLVKKYDRRIFNLMLNILRNHDDASDAYQNCFIKIHRSLPGFKGESSLFTWMYRIAINTAYTYYRQKRQVSDTLYDADFSEIEHLYRHDNDGGEDELFEENRADSIKKEIDKLSFQQKSVVYLKSYEGKKFREIAEILSLNEGTVKKYFHRAVQNIKKNLSESDI
ncbi:MAG: sigma-70 family RNA polymerase sigma factor [Candidatus Delongbacteria bacterium]|nr:sigma-70 family RNA polymerase sigma factor [Candidatus Delongbacteria bacterium]